MANYYASVRTNYFRVKDRAAFDAWAETIPTADVVTQNKDDKLVGILFDGDGADGDGADGDGAGGGLPSSRYNEETEDYDEFDFMDELSTHLIDGSVAIVMEAGAEKLRYIVGYAVAINNKGERKEINLEKIYKLASALGEEVTSATY